VKHQYRTFRSNYRSRRTRCSRGRRAIPVFGPPTEMILIHPLISTSPAETEREIPAHTTRSSTFGHTLATPKLSLLPSHTLHSIGPKTSTVPRHATTPAEAKQLTHDAESRSPRRGCARVSKKKHVRCFRDTRSASYAVGIQSSHSRDLYVDSLVLICVQTQIEAPTHEFFVRTGKCSEQTTTRGF
jgi:hypothetical protein